MKFLEKSRDCENSGRGGDSSRKFSPDVISVTFILSVLDTEDRMELQMFKCSDSSFIFSSFYLNRAADEHFVQQKSFKKIGGKKMLDIYL